MADTTKYTERELQQKLNDIEKAIIGIKTQQKTGADSWIAYKSIATKTFSVSSWTDYYVEIEFISNTTEPAFSRCDIVKNNSTAFAYPLAPRPGVNNKWVFFDTADSSSVTITAYVTSTQPGEVKITKL